MPAFPFNARLHPPGERFVQETAPCLTHQETGDVPISCLFACQRPECARYDAAKAEAQAVLDEEAEARKVVQRAELGFDAAAAVLAQPAPAQEQQPEPVEAADPGAQRHRLFDFMERYTGEQPPEVPQAVVNTAAQQSAGTKAPSVAALRESRKARNLRIYQPLVDAMNAKNAEWRNAVKQRDAAMRQWEAFVQAKNAEFRAARDACNRMRSEIMAADKAEDAARIANNVAAAVKENGDE